MEYRQHPLYYQLREARPSMGLHCVPVGWSPDGYRVDVSPCTVTDYGWLSGVIEEGFDPNGVNGPTYWRVAVTDRRRYYSTIKRGSTFSLIITELEDGASIYPPFGSA